MKVRSFSNNRGVALIVVILMISLIVAVTLEFNRSSRSSVHESANLADQIRLKYIAKSGFNLGVAVLLNDENSGFDALNEDWAIPEVMAAKATDLLDDESLQVTITDESGKIPVNKIIDANYRAILVRLLKQSEFGLDQQKAEAIADSIKDWIDPDEDRTGEGAESGYYKSLDKPYTSKNKALDCIDELLMIKGVTGDLYNGTKDSPGIKTCLTVYGPADGKININTAPKPVLRALFDISADTAEQLDAYRKEEGRDLSDLQWIKDATGRQDITSTLITATSNDFEISAVSRLNRMKGQVSGVIRRKANSKVIKLLSWKVE